VADFIPNSDDALKTWCTNFKSKTGAVGASVGLTPAQIAGLQTKCDAIKSRIDYKMVKKKAWESSVANCDAGNMADLADIHAAAASIKANGGFTNAIGADLGIVASAGGLDSRPDKTKVTDAGVT
jgi:hypothetical protein